MIDYALILATRYNQNIWQLNGDDYDGLVWLDDAPKPTRAELDALWPTVRHEIEVDQMSKARHKAFAIEADPLYFGWQRGENTEQAWLDKVAEIRIRYPYPA